VGRLFLLLLTGVSVAWVPIAAAAQGGQIFLYMQVHINTSYIRMVVGWATAIVDVLLRKAGPPDRPP
jgi:hypothetical protein